MKNPMRIAYLDTSVLLMLMGYGIITVDQRRFLNKMLSNYKIRIPQVAWGEAIAVILENSKSDAEVIEYVSNFLAMKGKITFADNRFPPARNEVTSITQEISDISGVVNDMDALILAHAIADDDVTHFFTTDVDMGNPRIFEYINGLKKSGIRKQRLRITVRLSTDEV